MIINNNWARNAIITEITLITESSRDQSGHSSIRENIFINFPPNIRIRENLINLSYKTV